MILKILILWAIILLLVWFTCNDNDDSVTKTINKNKKQNLANNLIKGKNE